MLRKTHETLHWKPAFIKKPFEGQSISLGRWPNETSLRRGLCCHSHGQGIKAPRWTVAPTTRLSLRLRRTRHTQPASACPVASAPGTAPPAPTGGPCTAPAPPVSPSSRATPATLRAPASWAPLSTVAARTPTAHPPAARRPASVRGPPSSAAPARPAPRDP